MRTEGTRRAQERSAELKELSEKMAWSSSKIAPEAEKLAYNIGKQVRGPDFSLKRGQDPP